MQLLMFIQHIMLTKINNSSANVNILTDSASGKSGVLHMKGHIHFSNLNLGGVRWFKGNLT